MLDSLTPFERLLQDLRKPLPKVELYPMRHGQNDRWQRCVTHRAALTAGQFLQHPQLHSPDLSSFAPPRHANSLENVTMKFQERSVEDNNVIGVMFEVSRPLTALFPRLHTKCSWPTLGLVTVLRTKLISSLFVSDRSMGRS